MKLCALLLITALVLPLHAAEARAVPNGLNQPLLAKIPARLRQNVEARKQAGFVALVARHGKVALLEAVGEANIGQHTPMSTGTIFQIMSMTKPVTAVGILMLAEEGKLALTDPVEQHLPEFKGQLLESGQQPARSITIRDLLTHTSGLNPSPAPVMKDLYQRLDRTLADAVRASAKLPLRFEPGSQWEYSNMGIATLGRIIETASGQSFEQFVQSRLLTPLGMKDTHFVVPAAKRSRVAMIYKDDGKLTPAGDNILGGDPTKFRYAGVYPAPEWGLHSTAPDLFRFWQMLLNGGTLEGRRYLSKASIATLSMNHTSGIGRAGWMGGTNYGLGVEVVTEAQGTLRLQSIGTWGHGGAFGTQAYVDPQRELLLILLVGRDGGSVDFRDAFFSMANAAVE